MRREWIIRANFIKLHFLTAESPPTEPCVTYQNKYVSPSTLREHWGGADTGEDGRRRRRLPRDNQVCQHRTRQACRFLLIQPLVLIYQHVVLLMDTFCLIIFTKICLLQAQGTEYGSATDIMARPPYLKTQYTQTSNDWWFLGMSPDCVAPYL